MNQGPLSYPLTPLRTTEGQEQKIRKTKNMAGNQSDGLLNDQSKKISVCGGCTILGQPPPEDPVCDSGIYCYGKSLTHLSTYFCKYLLQA